MVSILSWISRRPQKEWRVLAELSISQEFSTRCFDTLLGLHRSCITRVVKPLDTPRALGESLYRCKTLEGLPRIMGACAICGHGMLTLDPLYFTSISSSSSEEMSLRSPGLLTPAPIAISSAYTSRIYSTAGRLQKDRTIKRFQFREW